MANVVQLKKDAVISAAKAALTRYKAVALHDDPCVEVMAVLAMRLYDLDQLTETERQSGEA